MTSDFRHSFASEEEWAALEPVLENGFSAFFFGLGFLIIFPNGVYETSSSIRLRGVEVVHLRVKFGRVAEAASLSQSSPPLFWSHELDSGRFSSVANLA